MNLPSNRNGLHHALFGGFALSLLLLGACGDPVSSTPGCESGEVLVCECANGATGISRCLATGYTPCSCDDPSADAGDGSGDAGTGGDLSDTGGRGDTSGGGGGGSDGGSDADPDLDGDDRDGGTGPDDGTCEEPVLLWPDQDNDGYGDGTAEPELGCPGRRGWVPNGDDCDDLDPYTWPGAPELCDGIDNNCNGIIDENVQQIPQWVDADGDGYGDPRSEPIRSCAREVGYAPNNRDCDDTDGRIHPGAEDICDGIDNNCNLRIDEDAVFVPWWIDADEDGFGARGSRPRVECEAPEGWVDNDGDCNDDDPTIHPDAEEICDLIDNNCNGIVDEGTGLIAAWVDADGDGFGDAASRVVLQCTLAPGYVLNNLDCDDADDQRYPGAPERCNGVDDNCDGQIDFQAIDAPTFWADRDGDGYGDPRIARRFCEAPAGWVDNADDCDDLDAAISPAATEVCNGIDDNCNGRIDEGVANRCGGCGAEPAEVCGDGLDTNCDGTIDSGCSCDGRTNQPCYTGPPGTLGIGICRGGAMDCACPGGARFCTNGTWGACGGQVLPTDEICNGLDDNCNGRIDEGVRNACGDCGPAPVEVCNGVDDNCNGLVDEGLLLQCGLCPGTAPDEEICGNGLDDNCNGLVDEGCPCAGTDDACYPGPAATRDVGVCSDGFTLCYEGAASAGECFDAVLPSPEVCNSLDDDCDGLIDNGPDGCSVCGRGDEICDGVDNNCNGFVDEGLRNACGQCLDSVTPEELGGPALCNGLDDDCDGFIDEGLLNACGTCGLSCYVDGWRNDAELGTGSVDGTGVNDGVRLDSRTSVFNDLWIANSGADTVTRINTATNTVIGTYTIGIHAGGSDDSPSRTAIDLDGNAWIANRAPGLRGSVTKILGGDCVTGCVQFNIPVGSGNGLPRALAIDAEGYVWVGLFNDQTAIQINPTTGAIMNTYNLGISPYGFAIDSTGILWIATISNQGIGAFNLNTRTMIGNWQVPGCSQPYGIAIDNVGNVWTGNWTCGGIVRLDRASFNAGTRPPQINRYENANLTNTRGVAFDQDGVLWVGASGTNRVGRFNPTTLSWLGTYESCTTPTGVGVAGDGAVWSVCLSSNNARRHTPLGPASATTLAVGSSPYSYSDMTGFQLRNVTTPRGFWRQIFNCGFDQCQVDGARWVAETPAGTSVALRFRSSTNAATWSAWTPEYTASPATFTLPRGRYVEVEARLQTDTNGVTPVLRSVELDWQRP